MKHTIQNMKEPLIYFENKKEVKMIGYAFIDECGRCFMIVYGEGRRDAMKQYLSEPTDELNIKYQYVDMPT